MPRFAAQAANFMPEKAGHWRIDKREPDLLMPQDLLGVR
jgi:hypothetical protein